MLTGKNGILKRAGEAKEKTEIASEQERLTMAINSAYANQIGTDDWSGVVEKEIKSNFKGRNVIVNSFNKKMIIVSFPDSNTIYTVNGEINKKNVSMTISNEEDLKEFRDKVNEGESFEGETIILGKDIYVDSKDEWIPIGIYPNTSTKPSAPENKTFKGFFDGMGRTIDGIRIDTSDKVQGLFGLTDGAVIQNLTLGEKSNIKGGVSTGGIVGYLYNNSIVYNCTNKAEIKSSEIAGGISGQIYNGKILSSYNYGTVVGENIIGGITGGVNEGSIEKCYNFANLKSSGTFLGGITGSLVSNAYVRNCCNDGKIEADGNWIGGIIGIGQSKSCTVEKCYNKGRIYGKKDDVGGIAGKLENACTTNSYNVGEILGDGDNIGGIVGVIENAQVYNNYNIGKVQGEIAKIIGYKISEDAIIDNNYYLSGNVTNENNNELQGVTVMSSDEIKSVYIKLGNAFTFDENNINNGYPILLWQMKSDIEKYE
jgi:hypothetical protein